MRQGGVGWGKVCNCNSYKYTHIHTGTTVVQYSMLDLHRFELGRRVISILTVTTVQALYFEIELIHSDDFPLPLHLSSQEQTDELVAFLFLDHWLAIDSL
jgi:hypothetical protein